MHYNPCISRNFLFVFPQTNMSNVTNAYFHPVMPPDCRVNPLFRMHAARTGDNSGHNHGRDSIHDTICRIPETGTA
jgi:hypothetical protein